MHTGATIPVSRNKLLATAAADGYAIEATSLSPERLCSGCETNWTDRDQRRIPRPGSFRSGHGRSVRGTGFRRTGRAALECRCSRAITGLTLGTTRAHLVRATLEAIAYQTRELIDAMQADSGARLAELRVDGGAAHNDFLMQFQSDILGCRIVRPVDTETTALGAAYLAGLATGIWKSTQEVEQFWRAEKVFEPQMGQSQREDLFAGWKRAVKQA